MLLEFLEFEQVERKFDSIIRAAMAQLDPIQEAKLYLSKRARINVRK